VHLERKQAAVPRQFHKLWVWSRYLC
jgi:hypothetical protein